jgi:2-keto-3-deoxy-L-rhamnonate aldolase RhmA
MKWARERVLNGDIMAGTFLNLGSSLTAEVTGKAGFDWVVIDLEHGAGDRQELLLQVQALEITPVIPVVRIAWNDPVRFKRVLDLGLSGVMVPYVQSPEEARQAVAAMRYPPAGIRGVAAMNRACNFGLDFTGYFEKANENLLTLIQIETKTAVECVDEIAAVDGVDVLFVGPLDLSVSLGVPQQWDHSLMRDGFRRVVHACRKAGKAAGLIVSKEDQIGPALADGFTVLALSSDGAVIADGMRRLSAAFKQYKKSVSTKTMPTRS